MRPTHHMLVCTNLRTEDNPKGSCGRHGSEDLFTNLKLAIHHSDLKGQVLVNKTNCLKTCSHGSVVVVHPENTYYGGVSLADIPDLIDSHIRRGEPVERLLLPESQIGLD